MDKKFFQTELGGFAFVSILGTLCHFVYQWSGYSNLAGAFTPINESPWEHLKLICFPYLLWSFVQYFLLKRPDGYWPAKFFGNLTGIMMTTIFFYTYSGIWGSNTLPMDIFSFFLGVFVAFFTDYMLFKSGKGRGRAAANLAVAGLLCVSVLFIIFTYAPPHIAWFLDAQAQTYGI